VRDLVVARLLSADHWHLFGKWGTVSGRVALAGVTVVAAAVGVGLLLLAKRLPKSEGSQLRKTLVSLAGLVVAVLLLADIVFVIEGIAHVIWPNFVDTGGGD
jgi:hypothetical protein